MTVRGKRVMHAASSTATTLIFSVVLAYSHPGDLICIGARKLVLALLGGTAASAVYGWAFGGGNRGSWRWRLLHAAVSTACTLVLAVLLAFARTGDMVCIEARGLLLVLAAGIAGAAAWGEILSGRWNGGRHE